MKPIRNLRRRPNWRKGSVAVEFAMIAPIFFVIVFASIEFARVHMIQSAVENACFEGARRGIVPGATADICKTRAETLLNLAKVSNHVVTVTPAVFDATTQEVTVSASIPLSAQNGFGLSGFFQDKTMNKSITLPMQVN